MKINQPYLSLAALLIFCFSLFKISDAAAHFVNTRWLAPKDNTLSETTTSETAIRVALLLDTSSSMSGLIEQAKSQLWKIVNELTNLKHQGETPKLHISLYEYGNSRLSHQSDYIRQLTPFTTDMDKVSEELFALTTSGGSEYCGMVIKTALTNLDWGNNQADLKMIYIAGNESFAQGPFNFLDACGLAVDRDVKVNTIYCGNEASGISERWQEGAQRGHGSFMTIDHNQATVYTATPYDDQIQQLNKKLNTTYIPYGKKGKSYQENQVRQDANASKYSKANYVDRAAFKSSSSYSNDNWDLVDAYKKDKSVLKNRKQLSEEMRQQSEQEIIKAIEGKQKERAQIQQDIRQLNATRQRYISEQQKTDSNKQSLQNSILESVRKVAKEKNYSYGNTTAKGTVYPNSEVDYPGFAKLTAEVEEYRKTRLVDFPKFKKLSKKRGVILLDTRSKEAYDKKHIKGAIHLNFSDFTADKLAQLIPSQKTTILIYCNNNIARDPMSFALKSRPLALNIPTFINLYGYGYKNIYELSSLVDAGSDQIEFEGALVRK